MTTNLLTQQRPQDAAQGAQQQPPGTDGQDAEDEALEGRQQATEVDADTEVDDADGDGEEAAEEDADQGADDADQEAEQPRTREQRYRLKLRAAEADLTAARELVGRLQQAAVTQLAGQYLAQGADLLAVGGVEVAALLDADGLPDPTRVGVAARNLIRERPGLAPRWPAMGSGDRGSSGNGQDWTAAFAPR